MKSILYRNFKYTNAASTDLRKTFARVRRQQILQKKTAARSNIAMITKKKS